MTKEKDPSAKLNVAPGQYVYIGPDLRKPRPLAHAAVFRDGLPDWAEENADIKALCLPVAAAGGALRELQRGKGALLKHYAALQRR